MALPFAKEASPDASQNRSHGRGGAGNINARPSTTAPPDTLHTPTLKGANYTTGRGGSGNIVPNNPSNPAAARLAQDVDAPAHHEKELRGTFHYGRGGEGNMLTLGKSGAQEAREKSAERRAGSKERPRSGEAKRPAVAGERRGSSVQNAIEKGKDFLGLSKKDKDAAARAKRESVVDSPSP